MYPCTIISIEFMHSLIHNVIGSSKSIWILQVCECSSSRNPYLLCTGNLPKYPYDVNIHIGYIYPHWIAHLYSKALQYMYCNSCFVTTCVQYLLLLYDIDKVLHVNLWTCNSCTQEYSHTGTCSINSIPTEWLTVTDRLYMITWSRTEFCKRKHVLYIL